MMLWKQRSRTVETVRQKPTDAVNRPVAVQKATNAGGFEFKGLFLSGRLLIPKIDQQVHSGLGFEPGGNFGPNHSDP